MLFLSGPWFFKKKDGQARNTRKERHPDQMPEPLQVELYSELPPDV